MVIQNYILPMFLVMLIVNLILFLFMLGRKIYMQRSDRKKDRILEKYEENFTAYMTHQDERQLIIPSSKLERKVLEELLLTYGSFLTKDSKIIIMGVLGRDKKIQEIRNNLKSNNPWKKKISTYQAGEFGICEVTAILLDQLKSADRELLYVTARGIIKLEGKKYLTDVLEEVGKEQRMEKNNILVLTELVEEDIKDILEEMMLVSNNFLQVIALEIYGKRQYMEGVPWIKKMVSHPLKEIRVAALKGANGLGDIGEDDYFNKIASLEKDEEWEVRAFLAKFLQNVRNEQAILILAGLIKDPNWYVRNNSALALKEQGKRGLETLVELLDSKDRFARDKAREVLHKEIIFHNLLGKLENESFKKKLSKKMETELLEVRGNY